nr:uncharacterized protein LOC128673501 [Plodia interpunctella]
MWQLLFLALATASDLPPSCDRPVYCDSALLHHVQMARVFSDSKTFVDYEMRYDQETTLAAFDQLLKDTNDKPDRDQLRQFVDMYFNNDTTTELENWMPTDYTENPEFLNSIADEDLRKFGKDINDIWPILGKKVTAKVFENPDRHSLIPVSHGFIIPGGRFKELYYWDTYWIIEGLLVSGMTDTVKNVIENLMELVEKVGHIPNGSRWYYQQRSQPPLLTAMVAAYFEQTSDTEFLANKIDILEKEIKYWLDTQIVAFEKDGRTYTLLRYYAPSEGPRPESYYEDYTNAQKFETEDRKREFYVDLKSAAESGWDFSSRWFIEQDGSNDGDLTMIHTKDLIPVDLNAIFANALNNMAYFKAVLKRPNEAAHWGYLARQWRSSIEDVLWDEEGGVWFDYDMSHKKHRKYFFASNIAPLWMGAIEDSFLEKHAHRVVKYLRNSKGLDYPGGIPASLNYTKEQWDFPNAWPPLVSIVVNALEMIGTEEAQKLAFDVAQTWVRACHKGFTEHKQMFEKYDVQTPGGFGDGGEYTLQFGFGWSNGVVLEFLKKYGSVLTAKDPLRNSASEVNYPEDVKSNESDYNGKLVIPIVPNMPTIKRIYPFLGLLGACVHAVAKVSVCNSSIYCSGELLHRVQLARLYPDSKTFVDLKLKFPENETLADFAKLMHDTNQNPSHEQLLKFVDNHFVDGNQLLHWNPPDFNPKPPILEQISDPKLREFAKDVIQIWAKLGRTVDPDVAEHPERSSLLYVPNGFIVPGGRFKELYYWDSYWMVRGLLLSNMVETAKGMIENLLYLVEKIGYMPNGGRIYYFGRSHPPLLTAMVARYFEATGDIAFIEKHITTVEKELQYWLDNKRMNVIVDETEYVLLRYVADGNRKEPRPESYYEDYTNSLKMREEKRENFYLQIKSAAESGWDFSSRWFVSATNSELGTLTDLRTTSILPVDLNAIFAGALELVGDFRSHLKHRREALKWWSLAKYWRNAIAKVLWDSADGVWYDYDMDAKSLRKHFYPSFIAPLWAGAVDVELAPKYGAQIVKYLLKSGALDFPGGVPTSILNSGEQWDYPNAWPPLQSILIFGLDKSGDEGAKKLAKEQAKLWLRANYIGYSTWQKMFEKYSVLHPGQEGTGGEYLVQDGFGWTNGVVLELLSRYGKDITLDDDMNAASGPCVQQI